MFVRVALIHSSARAVPLLTEVARDVMAEVDLLHMVDEGIERLIEEAGGVTEPVIRRACSYAMNAQEAGAEAVLLASPAVGPAIDAVRASTRIPAVRMDEAMADTAVEFGSQIGVLAARETALRPVAALLRERADAHGKAVVLETNLCESAARALDADDFETFDKEVLAGVERLADSEVVVLADPMMHRALNTARECVDVPLLAGPRSGLEDLAKKLNYFRR